MEDKFIARLPDIELLIVPDNQHFFSGKRPVRDFFSRIFKRNKLLQKYKTANRILDISDLIERAAAERKPTDSLAMKIAEVLARAFERSCSITDGENVTVSWNGEDIKFFDEINDGRFWNGAVRTKKRRAAERIRFGKLKRFTFPSARGKKS